MRIDLYQKCSGCGGTQITANPMMVDGLEKPDGTKLTGYYAAGRECPCAWTGTPGMEKTGLSLRQAEAIREDRDRLLIALDDLSRMTSDEERAGYNTQLIGRRGAEIEDIRQRMKI